MLKQLMNRQFADLWLFKAVLFLIAFIPLYPKFPLFTVSGTYVAIRLEDVLIGLVILFWFLSYIPDLKKLLSKTIYQAFAIFWLAGLLSVISAVLITFSVSPHLALLHWLRRVEVMSLFFLGATVIKSRQQLITLLKWFFVVNLIVVIYGFGQLYFGFPVVSTTNKEFSKGILLKLTNGARVNSTFAGHYDLAIYLSIMVVFIGLFFFHFKKLWIKGMFALSGMLSFILLGLTAARVSFAAAIFGLALGFWYTGKKLLIVGLIVAALGVIGLVPELRHRLVATLTVNILEGGGPKYTPAQNQVNIFTPDNKVDSGSKSAVISEAVNRLKGGSESATLSSKPATISADIAPGEPINTTELGVYRSFNIRTDVEWPRAIRAFEKNPLLGTGYSSITIATDNDYLRSLGETGLLGTISFALVFFIILKRLLRGMKKSDGIEKLFLVSSLAMVVVIFITSTFIDAFEASKIASLFWLMLGVGWSVSERLLKND